MNGVDSPLSSRLGRAVASPWFGAGVLAFGLAARIHYYLAAHSYWYDESFLILPIRERAFSELLGPQPYNLVIPPGFLALTKSLYELGGDGELVLRLPSFVAGLLALMLMIPLARAVAGGHGLWAVAFLAVSRHALSHGAEVRPYTTDLLLTVAVTLAATHLTGPPRRGRTLAWAGLLAIAVGGLWFSFATAFALAGASVALAIHIRRRGSRGEWLAWAGFNAAAAASTGLLWYASARHMYYAGMIEHWGHAGWGGFPEWGRPVAVLKWLVTRPVEIGNYGTREGGVVLTLLALVGGVGLAKRAPARFALLTVPFAMTVVLALVGKYPLAHRTGFFLLPSLWLLAALGIGELAAWTARKGWWNLGIALGLPLMAWDAAHLAAGFTRPANVLDYRGAYRYVDARRGDGDGLWSQTGIVCQTYYGKDAAVLLDHQLDEAVRRAKSERLWVVAGDTRHDLRERFESTGARLTHRHHVSGLAIYLFEPGQ
jgi:hypothetical protein